MAKAKAKPKMSPARKKAVTKLKHVEDGIATLEGVLGGYRRDVEVVKTMLEGDPADGQEEERKP